MRISLVLITLLITQTTNAQSPLWGGLKKGPHYVGFKTYFTYDYSRPALVEQDLYGKVSETPPAPARQMQIAVWYPSAKDGKKMLYQDYIFELAKEIDNTTPTEERKTRSIDKLIANYRAFQNPPTFDRTQLNKIMPLQVAAIRDAKPAAGKFPVLVYPHWFSPMDGSIMGEYLASEGFVVVAISMKGSDSVLPEISVRGFQAIAEDIRFTLNFLSDIPFVDVTKSAVMGVGFNATGCIAAMKEVSTIDAFVSLDGGIITQGEFTMFQQSRSDLVSLAKPMLFINAPHPSINPEIASYFKYADKYYLRFPKMSEYYFLNNGELEAQLPGIIGTPPGDVKTGFETAAVYVGQFLKFVLNGDAQAKAYMERQPADNQIPAGIVEPSFQKAAPVPPSLHDLKVVCANEKAAGLRRVFDQVHANDAQPFTTLTLAELYNWLGYLRDDDFSIRIELAKIWIESHPTSARGPYLMARLLQVQQKPAEAKPYYQKALDLLPDDADIFLDNAARLRVRNISTTELKK